MFFRKLSKFIEETMVPNFFHVIPGSYNSMFNWIFQIQNTFFSLSFFTNIGLFLIHSKHYSRHFGSTNNWWKWATWGIFTSNTSFTHSTAIIYHNSGNFLLIFIHFILFIFDWLKKFLSSNNTLFLKNFYFIKFNFNLRNYFLCFL